MGFISGGNLAAAANSGLFLLLMRSGWELPLSRACVVSAIASFVSAAVGGSLFCHEPGAPAGVGGGHLTHDIYAPYN